MIPAKKQIKDYLEEGKPFPPQTNQDVIKAIDTAFIVSMENESKRLSELFQSEGEQDLSDS